MTYQELIELCRQEDPIMDEGDEYTLGEEGLVILGQTGDTHESSDVRILIEPDGGLRAWVRDPEGIEDPFHGPEWTAEKRCETIEQLRDWVYSW